MIAFRLFRAIPGSAFFMSILMLLTCGVPGRLHAQAFGPPFARTDSADWINAYSEHLTGDVSPNGMADMNAWFEWGTTAAYGNSTTPVFIPASFQMDTLINADISVTPTTVYHYRAAASNYTGTGYSADATFISIGPPVITNQPQSQAVAPGSAATFTVGALSILSLTYQWEKNGSNIASATTSVLTIADAQSSDAAAYSVLVSNPYAGGWTVSSSSASLNVGSAPTPFLQASLTQGNLILSWPVYQPGFNLESSTSPNSNNWTSVAATLVTNGNTITATIPASGAQRFFRLRYP